MTNRFMEIALCEARAAGEVRVEAGAGDARADREDERRRHERVDRDVLQAQEEGRAAADEAGERGRGEGEARDLQDHDGDHLVVAARGGRG